MAVTGLSASMAVAGAKVLSITPAATFLTAGASLIAVLVVHCGPAMVRSVPRLVLWPFWAVGLAVALWAHSSFIVSSTSDAGAARQASSPAAAAAASHRAALEQALAGIKARPTAAVARQLSFSTDPARVEALQVELQEARRADALRDQLVVLAAAAAAAATDAAADPLTIAVASALSVSPGAVQLSFALVLSMFVEIAGMLLWREFAAGKVYPETISTPAQPAVPAAQAAVHQVLQVNVHPTAPAAAHLVPEAMQQIEQPQMHFDERELDQVRRAISRGECNKTVESIRIYLACSSSKARSLRRAVLDA